MDFDNKKPGDLQFMLKPSSKGGCVNLRSPGLPKSHDPVNDGVPCPHSGIPRSTMRWNQESDMRLWSCLVRVVRFRPDTFFGSDMIFRPLSPLLRSAPCLLAPTLLTVAR
jgi:hypothetical protein